MTVIIAIVTATRSPKINAFFIICFFVYLNGLTAIYVSKAKLIKKTQ